MDNPDQKGEKKKSFARIGTGGGTTLAYLFGRYLTTKKIPSSFPELLPAIIIILLTIMSGSTSFKNFSKKFEDWITEDINYVFRKINFGKWSVREFVRWITKGRINPILHCNEKKGEHKWRFFLRRGKPFCGRKFCRLGPRDIVKLPPGVIQKLPKRAIKSLELECKIHGEEQVIKVDLMSWNIEKICFSVDKKEWPHKDSKAHLLFRRGLSLPKNRGLEVNTYEVGEKRGKLYICGEFAFPANLMDFKKYKKKFPRNICSAFEKDLFIPPFCEYNWPVIPRKEASHLEKCKPYDL